MSLKFRGADVVILIASAIGGGVAGPALSQPADGGQAAFDRQDFAQAEMMWRSEAAQGSPQAMFGLGLLNDLGLGRARDPAAALRWYLQAASLGMADAQFNAAVMLDSGIGIVRQPQAAAAWYGRAAAAGHVRAIYNLALLFAAGEGVPQNADLARLWLLSVRGDLAAADDYLQGLTPPLPGDRELSEPAPLSGGVDGSYADLAWAAGPAPEGIGFQVEIAGRTAPALPAFLLAEAETDLSALRVPLAQRLDDMVWRIFRVDPSDGNYAAGPWQLLSGAGPAPSGILQIVVSPSDDAAGRFAEDLTRVFEQAGYWTQIVQTEEAATRTGLVYSYAQDAELAGDVAAFLPGLPSDAVRQQDGLAPGRVMLNLVGGPGT